MAILDIDKSYIKIDYTHSGVIGGLIQVSFATYISQAERDKEKQREEKISQFLNNIYTSISELQNDAYNNWGQLSQEEIEKIKLTDVFIQWENKITNYQNTYSTFGEYAYKVVGEKPNYKLFLTEKELETLGFDLIWFTDPVIHNGFTTINCGEYDNINRPELNLEFFYNKLKEYMNPEVLDA